MNRENDHNLFPHFFSVPYKSLPEKANVGLWYEKYCYKWDIYDEKDQKGNVTSWEKRRGQSTSYKVEWIKTVTDRQIGDSNQLKEAERRMKALVEKKGGTTVYMKTTSRFVSGIGQAHYVENGFTFHHSLAVPYLPGSSVKGLVRTWATEWAEKKDAKAIQRIFGPETGASEKKVGLILFHDAFPIHPVQLESEMITPHYGPYYQDRSKQRAPLDSGYVKPIPFLTMAQNQTFLFSFMPRKFYPEMQEDIKKVRGWLIYALQWMGAGAKTASGYGRFIENPMGGKENR